MINLVEVGHGSFNFFKGDHLQKSLGNPGLDGVKTSKKNIFLILKFN